jgi:hypothetical protein
MAAEGAGMLGCAIGVQFVVWGVEHVAGVNVIAALRCAARIAPPVALAPS